MSRKRQRKSSRGGRRKGTREYKEVEEDRKNGDKMREGAEEVRGQ